MLYNPVDLCTNALAMPLVAEQLKRAGVEQKIGRRQDYKYQNSHFVAQLERKSSSVIAVGGSEFGHIKMGILHMSIFIKAHISRHDLIHERKS